MQFKRFVRYAAACAAAPAIFLFILIAAPASAQVTVTINGGAVNFAPAPIISAGRVFVPLRGVFERLGASVVYDSGTINATGNGRNISLHIGSTEATVNGQPQVLDVAPFIIGASTFVPLRFVSEALGAGVDWDDTNRVVAITLAGASQSYVGVAPPSGTYVGYAPPPIPVYEQPDDPAPNEMWQPGYWAWGAYGYYWVPGTWVEAPQTGYLWTPGYWSWNSGGYVWIPGYWGTAVGFYGGVNYGAGYYGSGYVGGQWSGDTFRYNTYVSRVNTTIVQNVYVDRNVYVNNSTTRTSYNGGPSGVQAHPTPQQLAVAKAPHLAMPAAQRQHIQTAAQDHRLLANVNHNHPPVLAVAHPLAPDNRPAGFVPVSASDRVNPQTKAPPAFAAPAAQPAPAYHAAPAQPAPAYHAPPVQPTPAYHVPPVHATPAYHAPPVHATPAYHAPPVHAPRKPPAPAGHATPHAPEQSPQPK